MQADGEYTLIYQNRLVEAVSGFITASSKEFLNTGDVDLIVEAGDPVNGNVEDVRIPFDRTVDQFTLDGVNLVNSSSRLLLYTIDPNNGSVGPATLTVSDTARVEGGKLGDQIFGGGTSTIVQ